MTIPDSLRLEHEQLHAKFAEATRLPWHTGEAGRQVAKILYPHFLREDEYAIPPLGPVAPWAGASGARSWHASVGTPHDR